MVSLVGWRIPLELLADAVVPDAVAVLGVDNDEVFCSLANPPLSSIALNAETAGYRAAELLDEMIQGRVHKPRRICVEALRVVTRRSTDIVAVEDEDVAAAIQFIHQKQGRHIVKGPTQGAARRRGRTVRRFFQAVHDQPGLESGV